MSPKHYYDRCYMQNFWLFIDWPRDKFSKYMKKKYGVETSSDELHDGKTIFMTNEQGSEVIVIWTANDIKGVRRIKVIAHECLHAVGEMYRRVGVKYSPDNDEPFTYMQGVLIEECLNK